MTYHIDPSVMYRIRSRGVERPAVEGHRLPQLVRDFVLARHDELSEDGELWFPASEVESLFPSVAGDRLIRERQHRDPSEQVSEHPGHVEDDRQFPREPWYVARASNVAGPYDQLTITQWYEEGCLLDSDQLRPGLHAKWRSLVAARNEGFLAPPPPNSCSVNAMHLVADPPVWMGPPTKGTSTADSSAVETPSLGQLASDRGVSNSPLILASVAALILFLASLAGLAWFVINQDWQGRDPGVGTKSASQRAQNVATSPPETNAALAERFSLLVPLSNQLTEAGQRIEVPLTPSDPTHTGEIRFQLESAPSTVAIRENMLSWVPDASDAGQTHIISVRVSDAANPETSELVSFEIEVMPASVVAADPLDAEEGSEIDAVVDLGLKARNGIRYSLVGSVPPGLSIDGPTGRLHWIPNEQQSPSVVNVGVQAHNASGRLVAESEIQIRVAERNRILQPSPVTAQVGETMSLQLRADTPRPDDRYFFVKGRVRGMFLDPDSGELRWNPRLEQAPAVYNVTVGLSDRITSPTDLSRFDHREIKIPVTLGDQVTSMTVPFFDGINQKQRVGHVQLEGRLLKAVLISPKTDDFSDLRDLQLVVDLDGDGTLYAHDGSAERFALSDLMNLNGQVYRASDSTADGTSLTLTRSSGRAERKPYLVPGYPAPVFRAQTDQGKTFDLRRECAKSQLVLLEFWADWCPPCRRMYEDLSEINRRYDSRGLTIIGINRDHDLTRAREAIAEHQLAYEHIFDNVDDSPGIGKKYRVKAIPRTYLLDSKMQIVAFNLRGDALKEKLEQLLKDSI